MRWCKAQSHAIMYLESQEYTLNARGNEIVSKPLKKEYCSTEKTIHRAVPRLDQDTTSNEEESTERCLPTRVKNTENEETARRGGEKHQSTLLFMFSSIFITTTVRYHGDNKHITHREQTPKHGITLKTLIKNRGGSDDVS